MAKTVEEIEKLLSERYDGPTLEKNGFTYIPWHAAAKVANRIFGIDGYDVVVHEVRREGAGFMACVVVNVSPSDGPSFSREGVGYNELSTRRDGAEMVDTAIKGAVSDALNRALKLFGDAFGLYLYDKDDDAHTAAPKQAYAPRQTTDTVTVNNGGGKEFPPSAGQLKFLHSLGYDDSDIAGMSYKVWKPILDNKTRKDTNAIQTTSAARVIAPVAASAVPDDDLPF